MTEFLPLRGLKYNLQKFDSLDELICPPFDLISPELKQALERKNQHNAVWLEGTAQVNDHGNNKYIDSRNTFNKWLDDAVIIRDETPLYYLINYNYDLHGNNSLVAGIIGMLRVEDPSTNNIIGHENTYLPIVEDRIQLLKTTGVQFSPILAAFKDSSHSVKNIITRTLQHPPESQVHITATDFIDIWEISNDEDIKTIKETLGNSKVFIADGHHRYEAALGIQNSDTSTFESQHIMAALIDINDPGLQILPYHRIIENVSAEFTEAMHARLSDLCINSSEINIQKMSKQEILTLISKTTRQTHTICTVTPNRDNLHIFNIDIKEPPESWGLLAQSDAWVLQNQVIDPSMEECSQCEIRYTHDLADALDTSGALGIFLGPFPKNSFEQVALSKTNMPPKSTFFYPKMPTGLLFHPIYLDN